MDRLKRFLYSRGSIVGSALAIGGLALHLVGFLGGPLWLPIIVGLYLIPVLLIPPERDLDLAFDAAADADEIRRGLDRLVRQVRGRVAADILERVGRIRDSILATLEVEPDRAAGDPNVHLIRQTALDYLPSALAAYLALPRAYAEGRGVAGGKTPHHVLLEQLDLLDLKMREAADAILAHDSERLLANGRFLADRFATSSLQLGQPGGQVVPPNAPRVVTAAVEEPVAAATAGVSEPARTAEATHAVEAERDRVR